MDPKIKARRLLKKIWQRAQMDEPKSWSLRRTAKRLDISPSYLSLIFSGHKSMTSDIAEKLIALLKPARLEKDQILVCFRSEPLSHLEKIPCDMDEASSETYLAPMTAEWMLGKWFRLPLLDLLTTENCASDAITLAKRLGVSEHDITQSLHYFSVENLAKQDVSGRWIKTFQHIRFPASTSREAIRNYHRAQLKRVDEILQVQVAPADYSKRLIIGLSAAVNPEHLDEVKAELEAVLYRAAHRLSSGPCQEVYQLNLQLVPQTKSDSGELK